MASIVSSNTSAYGFCTVQQAIDKAVELGTVIIFSAPIPLETMGGTINGRGCAILLKDGAWHITPRALNV